MCDSRSQISIRLSIRSIGRVVAGSQIGTTPATACQIGLCQMGAKPYLSPKYLKVKERAIQMTPVDLGIRLALATAWVAFQRSAPFASGEEGACLWMAGVVPNCV